MNSKEIDLFGRALDDLNKGLKQLQELAGKEFNAAFDEFRSIGIADQKQQILNQNYYDLHCYDAFVQHTGHLISIHNLLRTDTSIPYKNVPAAPTFNIARLNQLQFDIAWAQWDISIKRIKQFLINHTASTRFKERMDQGTSQSMLMTAKNIQTRFGILRELCATWAHLDLLPRLRQVRESYTLSAEIWVLNAYLDNMLVFPETILITMKDDKDDKTVELF